MLRILKHGVSLMAAVAAGILVYAATLPDDFKIARAATIKAPPEKIFPLIVDLKAFNSWNPFAKQDPTAKMTYGAVTNGKGAGYAWDSEGQAGKGNIEIAHSVASSQVTMMLNLEKPMEAHNTLVFALRPRGAETEESWTMTGDYPYIAKVMGVVFNMDKMVGGAFESGLADLKVLAEK